MRLHVNEENNSIKIIGMTVAIAISIGLWFGIIAVAKSIISVL